MTLPRVECLAAATVMRVFGEVPDSATPADYERVLQPIYGLADGLVSAGVGRSQAVRRTRPSELAWQAIAERGRETAASAVPRLARRSGSASRPASGPSTACSEPTSTPTSQPPRSPRAGSRPRSRWRAGSGSMEPT